VEVVYAHQNIRTFRREVRAPALSHRLKELLALAVLQNVVAAFTAGRSCWTAGRLAEDLDLPVRTMQELLRELVAAGFLVTTADDPPCFQPAREPAQILVGQVLAALKDYGGHWRLLRLSATEQQLQGLLSRLDAVVEADLAGLSLKELATAAAAE
jgi:membrane protein